MRDFELRDLTINPQRARALIGIVAAFFLVLLGRLWYMQIIKGDEYSEVAINQRTRVISLFAPRGMIYDRNHNPLVTNRMAFTVSVLPDAAGEIRRSPEKTALLAEILEISQDYVLNMLSPQRRDRLGYEPYRIAEDVGAEKAMQIYEQSWRLPGVIVEKVPVRHYVYDSFAAHVLGHVGMISASELRDWSAYGYGSNHKVGKYGIERFYEFELKGTDGAVEIEIDARQMPVREVGRQEPVRGNDLILTLDFELQAIAEEVLDRKVEEMKDSDRPINGAAVIIIDPNTGEVLTLLSYPDFNPNTYNLDFTKLESDSRSPLLNRVTRGAYPPGSAFKPIVVASALHEGIISRSTTWFDAPYPHGSGGWEPEYGKRCVYGPHGTIDILRGLQVSCNIPFYEIGKELGIDKLSELAKGFGFNQKTGIDLYPEEVTGLIPDRQWKKNAFSKADDKVWYPIETLDVAIGQGATQVTPVQMVQFYAAIANGGKILQPYLVAQIVDAEGNIVQEAEPVVTGDLGLKKTDLQIIQEGMERVTATGGTAARAFDGFPLKVAGKTGSAEVPGKQSHAWFAGYLPADDPKYAVCVFVENGGSGGANAAPIAREIFERYLFPEVFLEDES
ncbi:MAG: penicillin-binding protein 2 [Bacillota bacterium]|jgi:penicillin-binding protein 2|nr:penicillin-binding protein 2 [Bacillota bacterium]NLU55258.1 penicillin-binding protein 2 [Bacillota bacterium]HOA91064.1 penicillin-binding protein 2 [Bacillota bacterium]HOP53017.1 penicillin-binding protein 2 [Bacillota bacterium]HPT61419.1 penicillin-binding protein 2 [Bacillota bacterium]